MSTSFSWSWWGGFTAFWQHLCEKKVMRPQRQQHKQQPMMTKPMTHPNFNRSWHDQTAVFASNLTCTHAHTAREIGERGRKGGAQYKAAS